MCVMHKQTKNRDNETACDKQWTRQRQYTFSYCTLSPHAPVHLQRSVTVNSTHGICTDPFSHSCIRIVQVRSIQWTPLVVHFKRVSIRIRVQPPPKCRTRQDGDLGTPRVAHVAAMLVGCSPLSDNLVRTTLSLPRLLHWLNTLCCT